MGYELIASGGVLDAQELAHYDDFLEEGQRGKLSLDLRSSISSSQASQLLNQLKQKGVEDPEVITGYHSLSVVYRKGMPWLAIIIPIIIALLITLFIMIVAWRFYRELSTAIGPTGAGLLTAALIGLGLFVAYKLTRRLR